MPSTKKFSTKKVSTKLYFYFLSLSRLLGKLEMIGRILEVEDAGFQRSKSWLMNHPPTVMRLQARDILWRTGILGQSKLTLDEM